MNDILECMNVAGGCWLIFTSAVGPTIQIKRVGASVQLLLPCLPVTSTKTKAEGAVMINLTFSHTTTNATKSPAKLQKPPS